MTPLFLDIHVLQTVPPSNLNRDDTGSPKTAMYGGVRRARVSSQAWKRAARQDFAHYLDTGQVGVRTKRAVELLAERIKDRGGQSVEDATEGAKAVLQAVGLKVTEKRRPKAADTDTDTAAMTEYLIFYSNQQLDRLADLALSAENGKVAKNDAKNALKQGHSFDIALFGRMVADEADLNVDASCQVAHALSTHAVTNEFDYYTAVDDKNPAEETGAGMIGTVEFNSSTLYRYATISVPELERNLGDATATVRAVEAFVRSFALSMPTGKQNTFANGTLPDAVVVMARRSRPVSLVGAFEDPVTAAADGGYVQASADALARYAHDVVAGFADEPERTWVARVGERAAALDTLAQPVSFAELVREVGEYVASSSVDQA